MGRILHPSPSSPGVPSSVDGGRLSRVIRVITWLTLGLAAEAFVVALLAGRPQLLLPTALFLGVAIWTEWARRRIPGGSGTWVASRLVIVTLCVIFGLVFVAPASAGVLIVAPMVALLLALPSLPDTAMRRLAVACWLASVSIVTMGTLAGRPAGGLDLADLLLLIDTGLIMAVLLYLLADVRTRLVSSSREMARLVDLSRDLSGSLDLTQVAGRLARHLQEATRADACVVLAYLPDRDQVITFAAWPPEASSRHEEGYALDDYPLTREVVVAQRPTTVSVADPTADAAEVAILRAHGVDSLLMVPLVVRGQTMGIAEISRTGAPFDADAVTLASSIAAEAAMALENARLHQELRRQAFEDGLTRLANRALFTDRLGHALTRAGRGPGRVAVLFLDIDGLKAVNDQLGHVRGDQVLIAVAERIGGCVRAADTVARLGGDEFAVLLEDQLDPAEAEHVARRVVEAVREPILLGETQVTVGISIGIAFSSADAATADVLLRDADTAMYRAKATGKARVVVFDPALRRSVQERRVLKRSLRGAAARDELRLQYQPIVRFRDGVVTGLEALVRWDAPGVQRRMPSDFIAMSEENGAIVSIGRWVIEEACRQLREWQEAADRPDLRISVNLSARQFQDPALGRTLAQTLGRTRIAPGALQVEITESVLMQHTQRTIDVLAELRASGVSVAIDDFGTGYSSLSYLQRFPVDALKIDRAFVSGDADDPGWVLTRAIVGMADGLGLQVIAEGIERPGQLHQLRAMGCGHGQGYLFSPPIDPTAVERLLGIGTRVVPHEELGQGRATAAA